LRNPRFMIWVVLLVVASVSRLNAQVLPRKFTLDLVPQYYQGRMECGPTAIRMILAYYGINLPQAEVVERCLTTSKGTNPVYLMSFVRSTGLKFKDTNGTIDDVARLVASGCPVLVHQWITRKARDKGETSHYRVVIGYDYDSQKIYMRDPSKSGLSSISFADFNLLWDVKKPSSQSFSSKNWMLAVYR
jgi:ABC-type bacteriocin/lantibiotic exporter with double-glycine peptidase domain